MKDKIPAYRVEIRSPDKMVALNVFASYLPTELIYDYKRHGQPTDAVAAEMICNEDGLMLDLPHNTRALYKIEASATFLPVLVGTVVIFSERVLV